MHPDDGTIHAWLDGALDAAAAAEIEAHVVQCASCAARVAEARGLIAASSRILSALDTVPADVIPAVASLREQPLVAFGAMRAASDKTAAVAAAPLRVPSRGFPRWAAAAAAVLVCAVGAVLLRPREASHAGLDVQRTASAAANERAERLGTAAPPAPESPAPASPAPASVEAKAENPRTMASADKEKDALTKSRETAEERLQAQAETKSLGYAGARKRASVSSTVAAAPPSGEVANASKLADTDSLRRDAKGFPSDSMVPGAVGRAGAAAPAAMPAQPVVTSAPANDQAKSDQARVDAAAAAPALPAVAALRLVDSTTVSHDGVAVQRKVYEVRPGVRVTLDIAAQVADRQAPVDARVRAKQVPAPAVAGMVGTLNTIIWSDSLGTQYTLSGLVSVEELEKIKAQMR